RRTGSRVSPRWWCWRSTSIRPPRRIRPSAACRRWRRGSPRWRSWEPRCSAGVPGGPRAPMPARTALAAADDRGRPRGRKAGRLALIRLLDFALLTFLVWLVWSQLIRGWRSASAPPANAANDADAADPRRQPPRPPAASAAGTVAEPHLL